MDLKQLETFRMVASTNSFTRAAKALGYAQSSVTGQIQALEKELGAAVFDRMSRRAVLTPAGERLMKYAEKILALAAEARVSGADDGAEPEGEVAVTTPESLLSYRLLPAIRAFKERYPRTVLRMRPGGTTADIRRQLMEGTVDVAFLYEEAGTEEASGICVCKLRREALTLIASPEHRLAGVKGPVALKELAGDGVFLTPLGCTYRNLFERTLIRAGVPYGTGLEIDSVESIKRCVAAGMGVTLLPRITVEKELKEGTLAELRPAGEPLWVYSQVMWHKNRWMSPAIRAFVGVMREVVGCEEDAPKARVRKKARAAVRLG